MELIELKNKLIECFSGSDDDLQEILDLVENDQSIYPFNPYEHLICAFIEYKGMSYQQYLDIRDEYLSSNPNLWIFEISAPRQFGESFAQTYIMSKSQKLQKASKKFDANYVGEYDLWLHGIKIEVKASRVVDSTSNEPLYMKALSSDTKQPFLMNFQQLKPQCCDVFIWLAVFRDKMRIWIIPSDVIKNHVLFSKGQHRGNLGNEGQLHMTHLNIHLFDEFELRDDDIISAIENATQSLY